jgi:hypothetical protein
MTQKPVKEGDKFEIEETEATPQMMKKLAGDNSVPEDELTNDV